MAVELNFVSIEELESRMFALAEPFGLSPEKVVLAYEQEELDNSEAALELITTAEALRLARSGRPA